MVAPARLFLLGPAAAGRWSTSSSAITGLDLASPEDVYAYARSDRFWDSWYSWFVRGLIWYAGLLHLFFAFVILGFVLPRLP